MAEKTKEQKKETELQRIPPHSEELEQSVLGAMMLDTEAFGKAVDWLDENVFYKPAHLIIYQAMMSLFKKSSPIDYLTVVEELKAMGKLDEVGGGYYISQLTDMVTSPASVEHYSKMLTEKSILRKVISVSTDTIDES